MLTKKIISVTVNPALDHFLKLVSTNNSVFKIVDEQILAGGKGINVARGLKDLSVPYMATGIVGGKNGKQLKLLLKKEGVKHRFFELNGETRVNLTFQYNKGPKIDRFLELGPLISFNDVSLFISNARLLLREAGLLVLSGRNANGAADNLYQELIFLARKNDVKVVLDSSGAALKQALSARPWLVKPNQSEAEEILKFRIKYKRDYLKACQRFHKLGAENVVITLGRKGAVISDGQCVYLAIPPKVNPMNFVGCGDAFLAGLLAAYSRGKILKDSLGSAVAAGTASMSQTIPGKIPKKIYTQILKKVRMRQLL